MNKSRVLKMVEHRATIAEAKRKIDAGEWHEIEKGNGRGGTGFCSLAGKRKCRLLWRDRLHLRSCTATLKCLCLSLD